MSFFNSIRNVFFSRIFTKVTGFFVIIIITREIGNNALGSYVLLMSIFGILSVVCDLGVDMGLTKRLSENNLSNHENGQILSSALIISNSSTMFSSGIVFILSTHVNNYLDFPGSHFMILLLIIDVNFRVVEQTLIGEDKVAIAANVKILQKAISHSVGIMLIFIGYGLPGMLLGLYMGRIVSILYGSKIIDTSLKFPNLQTAKSLFNYSKYSMISTVGGKVYSHADILLIGFFLTQSDVAVYQVVWQISFVFIIFTNSLKSAIFPKISQFSSEMRFDRVSTLLKLVSHLPLLIIIPGIVGCAIVGEQLLHTLFGQDFSTGITALLILLSGKIVQNYHIIFATTLSAMDYPELAMLSKLLGLLVNLLLNIVFIQIWGIEGAAFASVVAMAVNMILNYRYVIKYIKISIPGKEIFWALLSAAIMYITLRVLFIFVDVSGYLPLILAISFGALIYFSILVLSADVRKKARVFVTMDIS